MGRQQVQAIELQIKMVRLLVCTTCIPTPSCPFLLLFYCIAVVGSALIIRNAYRLVVWRVLGQTTCRCMNWCFKQKRLGLSFVLFLTLGSWHLGLCFVNLYVSSMSWTFKLVALYLFFSFFLFHVDLSHFKSCCFSGVAHRSQLKIRSQKLFYSKSLNTLPVQQWIVLSKMT